MSPRIVPVGGFGQIIPNNIPSNSHINNNIKK